MRRFSLRPRSIASWLIVGLGVLGALAPISAADEPGEPPIRTPEAWRVWRPNWTHLRTRPGITLYSLPAGRTTDPYPFLLAATDQMRKAGRAFAVHPGHFGRFVTAESLETPGGAAEAVRCFVPGRDVRSLDAARRVVAEAKRLAPTLVHGKIDVKVAGDPADLLPSDPSRVDLPGPRVVQLLVLQTDVQVRLVEVTGRVDAAKGSVEIAESVPVSGPTMDVLVCATGEDQADLEKRRLAAVEEAANVRRALLSALDPRRTREAVRRLAAPGVTMSKIREALGEPDDDVGSGIHIWVYALEEGAALVGEAGRIYYIHLESPVPGSPFPGPKSSESLWPPPAPGAPGDGAK